MEKLTSLLSSTLTPTMTNVTTTLARLTGYHWSAGLITVFTLDMIVVVAAYALHILGMILLLTTKGKALSNQSILLLHLSFVSLFNITQNAIAIGVKTQYRKRFPPGYIFMYFVIYIAYIVNLLYLSIDRLLFVMLTVKYRSIITNVVIYISLVFLWALAFSYGVAMNYGGLINHAMYNKYAANVYNGVVVVFTTLAYIVIILHVLRSAKRVNAHSSTTSVKLKKYLIPFFIVMSFFILQMLPHIIANEVPVAAEYAKIQLIGLIGMNVLNSVTDAVIYIFLQPKVRARLYKYARNMFFLTIGKLFLKKEVKTTIRYKDGRFAKNKPFDEAASGTQHSTDSAANFIDISLNGYAKNAQT